MGVSPCVESEPFNRSRLDLRWVFLNEQRFGEQMQV